MAYAFLQVIPGLIRWMTALSIESNAGPANANGTPGRKISVDLLIFGCPVIRLPRSSPAPLTSNACV